MPRRWQLSLVFLATFAVVSWNIWNVWIASGSVDPATHIGAQDEAVYTRMAIHMATRGEWLTQHFMDRIMMNKPPLLMWLSGFSAWIFGIAAMPLRLPSLLAASLACVAAFAIVERMRGPLTGCCALLLILSDNLFHEAGRLNMTDMLLLACTLPALWIFVLDTKLERRRTWVAFGLACGFAMLAKSIAGLLPFVAVAGFFVVCRRDQRPSPGRFIAAGVLSLAVFLPWVGYQLGTHREWFLGDFLGVQKTALQGTLTQPNQENQLWFYLRRLWAGDPWLCVLALTGLPSFGRSIWRRESAPLALLFWLAVFALAPLGFGYRNWQYFLPVMTLLGIVAALYSPVFSKRLAAPALVLLVSVFAWKAMHPESASGLDYRSGTTRPSARVMRKYCEMQRSGELIVIDDDAEFYATVLPIAKLRIAWVDPSGEAIRLQPYLNELGILLTPRELQMLPLHTAEYGARLRMWGVSNLRPVGTAIAAVSMDDLRAMLLARPFSDVYVRRAAIQPVEMQLRETHEFVEGANGRVLLLSRSPLESPKPPQEQGWGCEL